MKKNNKQINRWDQVQSLLNKDPNNFKHLTEDEKLNHQYIYQCLDKDNFNPLLLPQSILNDEYMLWHLLHINSDHAKSFTAVLKKENIIIHLLNQYIDVMPFLSEELKNSPKILRMIVLKKPNLYTTLPELLKDNELVVSAYLQHDKVKWNELPKRFHKKAFGVQMIRKNLNNLPDVINEFPELKSNYLIWNAINNVVTNKICNKKLYGAISEALYQKDEELLKTINVLVKNNIQIDLNFLKFLKNIDGFKDLLKNVDLENLNKEDNCINILRGTILTRQLAENKSTDIIKNKKKVIITYNSCAKNV